MKNDLSLEEVQQGSFNVLLKIKEICEKNNYRFYLTYGTLLGAVRHSGFIPWDDDIDIWMPRDDYEQFIDYCIKNKLELNNYKIFNYRFTKGYPYCISRFSDTRYKIDYSGIKDYGLGLFVDIYPLDYVDEKNLKYKKKQYRRILRANRIFIQKSGFKGVVRSVYKFIILFTSFKFTKKNYLTYVEKMAKIYNSTDKKDYMAVTSWEFVKPPIKTTDIVGPYTKYLPFNGVNMPVPFLYDTFLSAHYGNYMELPPENQRIGHHFYHAYKK